ncbi:MAG: RsmE family RNA methyltransferase [Candidatus Babeliales bacterium]
MKHLFTFYYSHIASLKVGNVAEIVDSDVVHRLIHIVRIAQDDTIILFDRTIHAVVQIKAISKRAIHILVVSSEPTINKQIPLIFLLPVLKKEALSDAVYALCELGVSLIQLITTQKTRPWGGKKELERLQRVIYAAAEQSKNFSFPMIDEPISLDVAVAARSNKEFLIVADPDGHAMVDVMKDLQDSNPAAIVVTVGPEGAFTEQELALLQVTQFHTMKLTETILRASQAAALLSGIIRTIVRNE